MLLNPTNTVGGSFIPRLALRLAFTFRQSKDMNNPTTCVGGIAPDKRHCAFWSYCIAPATLPSVSSKKIRSPTPTIVLFCITILPPFAWIAAIVSSIDVTEIVHS